MDPDTAIRGSYCTTGCFYRDKGENIRQKIRQDHRFCATCFRVRKEITKPPETFLRSRAVLIRDTIIGFETATECLNYGHGLTWCACGSIDHDGDYDWLREMELRTAATNAIALLCQLEEEGQLSQRPDPQRLRRTLRQSGLDWDLAFGKALYD